ncbi:MAG TPA: saccharopine dehydrogenase NADP-binding domain-containing protein [Thermoplasmata archaeon]|nr:saccharopine dehydrogenase NADP-binding domain-containing protein [Thermoplasmata archaeon]
MKVAVLGAGGLGRTVVLELAADSRVDEIMILDRRGDRSKTLQAIGRRAAVTALEGDVTDASGLRRILKGADVTVNATLPEHNMPIMKACYDVGSGYVDSTGCSPTTPGETWGVLEQLRLDGQWQRRGIVAIVSMGSDPGLSNVMARVAAEPFATVDSIRIRWAASGGKAVEGFPLYSREIFLRDALSRPVTWDGKRVVEHEVGDGEERFEFPEPVGTRSVHLFRHEEVLTLPLRLGKPVGYVDYKHAIDPNLVRATVELHALGLLARDRHIRLGDRTVSFRDAFLAAWPEPSTLIGPMEGTLVILVEVRGVRPTGETGAARAWTMLDHREANRRRGTTAEYFLTAACAATAAVLIGRGQAPRTGVLAAEELPPSLIVPELRARGVEFRIEDVAS